MVPINEISPLRTINNVRACLNRINVLDSSFQSCHTRTTMPRGVAEKLASHVLDGPRGIAQEVR